MEDTPKVLYVVIIIGLLMGMVGAVANFMNAFNLWKNVPDKYYKKLMKTDPKYYQADKKLCDTQQWQGIHSTLLLTPMKIAIVIGLIMSVTSGTVVSWLPLLALTYALLRIPAEGLYLSTRGS